MSELKILMLGWELAPMISGGLGVICRDLTESLVKKNVNVTFVVPKIPSTIGIKNFRIINLSDYSKDNNIQLKISAMLSPYISNSGANRSWRKSSNNEIYGSNMLEEVEKYSLILEEAVKNLDFNIIHAHDWMTAKAAINIKKFTGKPLILHIHSTEYDRTANNPNPVIVEQERSGLISADKIIAVSEYTKAVLINNYKIDPQKIIVVHNAVKKEISSFSLINKPKDIQTVLFLARLTVQKGADYLLKAARKVLEKRPNVKFVIVGQGDQLENLIDLSFELGISDHVVFTGALSNNEVDKAYRYADLFVMPSVSEPFGLTSLEAIRNGTPVIISKQSGVSEVIKNCLKVDFWDIEDMANKILAVLNNEALSHSLSSNGFRDLDNLTCEDQAEKIIEIYKQFLA